MVRKACPLLGYSYRHEPSVSRGGGSITIMSPVPCVGEMCINHADVDDGEFCLLFKHYISRKEDEDHE